MIGFPLFACLLIIHSATALSLFSACSWALSLVRNFIFLRALRCQGFLWSSFSSLLLLLSSPSSPPPLLGGIFLKLFWSLISFHFPLLGLLDPPENECPSCFFWMPCSGTSSASPSFCFSVFS